MQNQIDMFETENTLRLDACETLSNKLREEIGNIRRGFFAREAKRDAQIDSLTQRMDALSFALEAMTEILLHLQESVTVPQKGIDTSSLIQKVIHSLFYDKAALKPTPESEPSHTVPPRS